MAIFKRMNTTLKHFGAHNVPTKKNGHNIECARIFYQKLTALRNIKTHNKSKHIENSESNWRTFCEFPDF